MPVVKMPTADWDILLMILSYSTDSVFAKKYINEIRKQLAKQEN